jgi:NADPH-ferrihemoprotein reductase
MALSASPDVLVLIIGVVFAAIYLFRDQVFNSSPKPKTTSLPAKQVNGHGNPRDFV